jgi:hypothetical protein
MKRAGATVFVLSIASALVLAAPAGATTPTEKRLQGQVKTLQKQVKALQKSVVGLQRFANFEAALIVCSDAATEDAFQGTWAAIEKHDATGTTQFGVQQPADDLKACASLKVQRAPAQPTTSVLQSIVNIFK